ncbi:hypothetical protein OESDEN_00942 [Oesophagostomum dentatum]|uniref:Uncharacterized protein n=1 Tax=Oesophagostomum dentatum TaxID=61180 RepID=A0A0B1TUF4_OESDE|nr:hypothetical protein OESDEN_00942 [Oesophagostomum dentatum]
MYQPTPQVDLPPWPSPIDIQGEGGELGASSDWNIETVIDWKRIVSMYYQMNGKRDDSDEAEQ